MKTELSSPWLRDSQSWSFKEIVASQRAKTCWQRTPIWSSAWEKSTLANDLPPRKQWWRRKEWILIKMGSPLYLQKGAPQLLLSQRNVGIFIPPFRSDEYYVLKLDPGFMHLPTITLHIVVNCAARHRKLGVSFREFCSSILCCRYSSPSPLFGPVQCPDLSSR